MSTPTAPRETGRDRSRRLRRPTAPPGAPPLPPGPRGPAALPFVAGMFRDSKGPMVRLVREHGDVAALHARGRNIVVLGGHDAAEHVLIRNQDNYLKGFEYEVLRLVLGDGLLTSEGDLWRRQRRLVQPMFAKRHLGDFVGHMTAATDAALDAGALGRAADGELLDVSEAMMALTLDVVGRALFGADLSGDTASRVGPAMDDVLSLSTRMARRAGTFLAMLVPGVDLERAIRVNREFRRFDRARDTLDDVIGALLDERQARADPGDDLLGLLLGARDEDGATMDRTQVRDELMTFMGAGHETTANALAWLWRRLSLHPEARERMVAEVDEVLGDRTPTLEDADRLPWTRACVQEAMRLDPPVWVVGRHAIADDVLDGHHVPAGSAVFVLISMIHRDERIWPNPEAFDPRRFLPEQARGRPRHAYLPFGAGRRVCVGSTFALVEATLLAAMIARRVRFELPRDHRYEQEATITLRPKDGLPMHVRRRGDATDPVDEARSAVPAVTTHAPSPAGSAEGGRPAGAPDPRPAGPAATPVVGALTDAGPPPPGCPAHG